MAQNESEPRHTVIIVGVTDVAARLNVARALSQVAKNQTSEQIIKRLDSLPWTLTRSATPRRASRLVKMLEPLGAEMKVIPPLAAAGADLRPDTEILPGAELLSQSQMMSATQFMPSPIESEAVQTQAAPTASRAPASVAPGRKAAPSGGGEAAVSRTPYGVEPQPPDLLVPAEGFSIEPLSIGEILDRAFQICRTWFWKLFLVLVIPWLLNAALMVGIGILLGVLFGIGSLSGFDFSKGGGLALTILMGVILGFLVFATMVAIMYLAQGALIYAVSAIHMGHEVDVKESYGFVCKLLGRFIGTSILFTLVWFGLFLFPFLVGAILFGLFSLFTSGWWSVIAWPFLTVLPLYAFPKLLLFDKVVIIENVAYSGALHRSWNLLTGKVDGPWPRSYWGKMVLLLHVYMAIQFGIFILFEGVSRLLLVAVPEISVVQIVAAVFAFIVSQIGGTIGMLYGSVLGVVFYYDVRNRKEGFDLRMLAGMRDRL